MTTDGTMQDVALTLDAFLDHAAKWHPGAQVVTAREGAAPSRIGYAALRDRSLRVSAVLDGLGVARGDRVATLAWNTQAHVEAWFGIMGMGAVCHTLNPRLEVLDLARMVAPTACRVMVVSADLLPLARAIAAEVPTLETLLVIDAIAAATESIQTSGPHGLAIEPALAAAQPHVAWGGFDERTPSGLCFTSGTTGAPKGVTYTHRSTFLHTLRLLQADMLAIGADDSVLVAVPMFHASAWGLPFAAPAVGATLVLPGRRLDGADLADLIIAEGVTLAVGVPTVWLGLVDHLEASGRDVPSLRRILMGGAPLAPALKERIERRTGAAVQLSWGMTELSPAGTFVAPAETADPRAASGRPALGIDLRLTDAAGTPLPDQRNIEGHLQVRGASVVERYFGQSEPATDAQGWFDTGDLAMIDDDGHLAITGRAKDLIKSGGEWINPAKIEDIVAGVTGVAQAAVIGRDDEKWGERPILLVELSDGRNPSDEEILAPLRDRVASWWIPDVVIRVDEMPIAATGKLDKRSLRARYGNGAAATAPA